MPELPVMMRRRSSKRPLMRKHLTVAQRRWLAAAMSPPLEAMSPSVTAVNGALAARSHLVTLITIGLGLAIWAGICKFSILRRDLTRGSKAVITISDNCVRATLSVSLLL